MLDADTFAGLEARSIGPAVMSGRISAIDAVVGDKLTVFVGAASGGVWKSTDGGLRFQSVFDKHTQSIGALAIDRRDPKTVWVGTGESCTRNSVSVGDGVYKSVDGGDNWQHVGLKDSERIARIAIDPKAKDTVFVCAAGHLWDAHPERGVFRTKDGGQNWEKVLFVNADTGCADLAQDPQDPRILYAAMWQFRRSPDFFTSGGPGSGLYKSLDGGTTWRKLSRGLPTGELGRIAVALAPSRPSVVYATVEAKETALYRSDDLGESWTRLNDSSNVSARPFYFSHLVVDPKDPERVYRPGFMLAVSEDGGKTFAGASMGFGGGIHPDDHALWIHPDNPQQMLLGTDGGLYHTYDRGNRWRPVGTLPVSQFYHVSVDQEVPYNVYGGLQDNNTWYGPANRAGGIEGRHWRALSGGDGFWAFVDPNDPDLVYTEYQGGHLFRVRKSTGETKEIPPLPRAGEPKFRFNWNAPIHLSPTRPGTLYVGAQFLFRSRDQGESWERISPDLTTNDPAKQRQSESGGLTVDNSTAENHCTLFAISESPKDPEVIWAGTDDGNLQVSRNGGKTWTNVAGNVPGLPKGTWVSSVEAGRFQAGTAYATFDGHMTGDMKTYAYKTTDYGATWQALTGEALKGYAHIVREDLVREGLLFLGTESGLFVSLDGGARWAALGGGLPPVAVRDLAIHPREGDLVIATHGRGLYVVDDLTPLRRLTHEVLATEVALLDSRPGVLTIPATDFRYGGDDEFVGQGLGENTFIAYYLKKRHMFGDLRLEVYDDKGQLLSSLPGAKRRGLNRVAWPMRLRAPKLPRAATLVPQYYSFVGPRVAEGTYTVKLVKGQETLTGQVRLAPDPRSRHTAEDRALQQRTALQLYRTLETLTFTVDALVDLRDQARKKAEALPAGDAARRRFTAFADSLERHRARLVATRESGGITGEEKLREQLGALYGAVNGYEGRPTQSQLERTTVLIQELERAVADLDALRAKELPGLPGLTPLTREAWDKRQQN